MTNALALTVLALSLALFLYTYLGYPLVLWALGKVRRRPVEEGGEDAAEDWPRVSITVPAYNEEAQIRDLLESLLTLEYPRDRLQILVVSDASSDRTDEIVREYSARGVELLRMPVRGGKTRAENAAAERLRGDVVVNTDASIRIAPGALTALITAFRDPNVGCASGRDLSVGSGRETANVGESGYVGYEMWVRDLETRVHGIVGASGCFYAIRRELHRLPLHASLSRDFAAALHTHEHGYRPVSVPRAVCLVPRATSLRKEYARKVRTITRGMQTLWHERALLNPLRHGVFAWMLFSHKICRWMLPWAALASLLALAVLAGESASALALLTLGVAFLVLAGIGWLMDGRTGVPRLLSVPAFVAVGNLAAAHAFLRAWRGARDALWEPTRREVIKG